STDARGLYRLRHPRDQQRLDDLADISHSYQRDIETESTNRQRSYPMRRRFLLSLATALLLTLPTSAQAPKPIKCLIITGDHSTNWKESTAILKDILTQHKIDVDVTTTPAKDLTKENLARYDVFLLNYRDTESAGPDTKWTDANKQAFSEAVFNGKGLFVHHLASKAFSSGGNFDKEYEKMIGGGARSPKTRIVSTKLYRVLVRN